MNASDYEEEACLNAPVELFYDVKLYADVARVFCGNCPVKEQCLQDCLQAEETPVDGKKFRSGVFGGLSPSARNVYAGTAYDVLSDDWEEEYANSNSN
nr:MAG TPA: Transcription factor WhiB [Caudoviricetes sp.]